MADIWIQLSSTDRVIGLCFDAPPEIDLDIWTPFDFPEEHYEDYNLYRMRNGTLVYDPPQSYFDELEKINKTIEQDKLIESLPTVLSDTDAALCELFESTESSTVDTDAALCEIYEMLIDIQGGLNG